jgi:FkbM family methyltransferase
MILHKLVAGFRFVLWEIDRKFQKTVTIDTKQGRFKILLASNEYIGRSLFCHRQFELELMGNVTTFLRSINQCPPKGEGIIWDIGANNGVISIGMLKTGEFNKAIAIEPEPQNFSILQHNVKLNNLMDKILCLPIAISNQKGNVLFELSETNFGDHRVRKSNQRPNQDSELFNETSRRVISVQAEMIDNLQKEIPAEYWNDISLIWIDVQGYEGYAFQGADKLISKGIPIVTEFWPYGINQAGMSQIEFCDIARRYWKYFWVWRVDKFICYSTELLENYFEEIGYKGKFSNIIFTQ